MLLKQYLKDNKITASQFAEMLGVTKYAVGNYVRREKTPPLERAVQIIELTEGQVTPYDLLKINPGD